MINGDNTGWHTKRFIVECRTMSNNTASEFAPAPAAPVQGLRTRPRRILVANPIA
jgi:hypothetical protein